MGDDPSAAGYARAIGRTCKGVGVTFSDHHLGADATQDSVETELARLNDDPQIHGIMILEPLPDQINGHRLIDHLNPAKDVDGVHPLNAGRLSAQKSPYFVPATPAGAIRLLEEADVEFKGKQIRKGDKIVMWYLSGNRDENTIDNADEFIIDRSNPRHHSSFGFGVHRCMGNRLAEMQLRILWEEIMQRFSFVELVGEPERVQSNFVRGFATMPVKLHPL